MVDSTRAGLLRRAVLGTAVLLTGLLLPRVASRAPDLVESVYARGIFPAIARVLAWGAGAVRFSLAEALGVLLAIAAVGWLLGWIVRLTTARSLRPLVRALPGWIVAAAVIVWLFQVLWGLNHARPPLAARLGIEAVEPSPERLLRLLDGLSAEVARSHEEAIASGEIVRAGPDDPAELRVAEPALAARIAEAYAEIVEPPLARIEYAAPKTPALASDLLTRIGVSGVYVAYTGEATVNGKMPDAALPITFAHEMAHQRGTAREDEASFLGWLACRRSGLASARYSGDLSAFRHALGAYARIAPDSAAILGRRLLGPGPAADVAAIRAFWRRHEGPAARVADRLNDSYLKASGHPAGVRSYGRMVDLLLAYAESERRTD